MLSPRRARFGLALAQLGAVAMILGGLGDQLLRELPPAHLALLGATTPGDVSAGATALVLALLHALGYALIAAGIATFALLRQLRSSGDPKVALAAGVVAVVSEGANAFHMRALGLDLYLVPLAIMVLVAAGLILCALPRWAFTRDVSEHR